MFFCILLTLFLSRPILKHAKKEVKSMYAKKLIVALSIVLLSTFCLAATAPPAEAGVGKVVFKRLLRRLLRRKRIKRYLVKKFGVNKPIKYLRKRYNSYLYGCSNPWPKADWLPFYLWWIRACPAG